LQQRGTIAETNASADAFDSTHRQRRNAAVTITVIITSTDNATDQATDGCGTNASDASGAW
jgi:hypothetical protein